jgi:prepilin peptidase CpaA
MPVPIALDLLLLLLVVLAAANDLATRRIPNRLLLAGTIGALALHLCAAAPAQAALDALGGAATGLLLFVPLYCLRGMAAGDVKMMAAVGAFGSASQALHIALFGVCAGGLMALAVVISRGRLRAAIDNLRSLLRPLLFGVAGVHLAAEPLPHGSVGNIPYGLAIASGAIVDLALRYS